MQIRKIADIEQFAQLKTDWERVYAADTHAHIFVSWTWLRGWFEMTPHSWFVLAMRPDSHLPYIAFLPLMMRGLRIFKLSPVRVLHMGGKPFSNYTGFVCLPEYEKEALEAFAYYTQHQLDWDSFQLEDVLDPRLDLFTKWFSPDEFDLDRMNSMPSLYVPLPDDWSTYLQNSLGSKTRKNLRRSLRQIEGHNGFRVTCTREDTAERDIEALLTLWQRRWGLKPIAPWCRGILHHFLENGDLWLRVLWDGSTPVAARAGIIDQQKKTFYAFMISHNASYARLSPGRAMVGYSIRYAIQNGFRVYDFLRGADEHKLSFGAKQRGLSSIIIRRAGLRSSVANIVLNLSRQASAQSIKVLGKIKRIGVAKKIWFWSLALVKRVKR